MATVGLDLHAACFAMLPDGGLGHHLPHGLRRGGDDAGLPGVAIDGQMVLLGFGDDVPVTQVEAQQVGVRRMIEITSAAHGAVVGLLVHLASRFAVLVSPPADGPARNVELLGDCTVGDALPHQCDSLCPDRRTVLFHVTTVRDRR
ncbi:hypothetical protein GCM10010510_05430 [Streptomyces anandii JCM 4720]|nr:hypothetical protein GCM10010510_05430 [Streptomyces anandii JCM 4720]